MALAADVLDQDDLAGTDVARLAVACGDCYTGVEVDDVLPPGRGMPIQVIVAAGLAKDDAGRRQAGRELAAVALLDPLHLDIAPVRLARVVNVDVVNAHDRRLLVIRPARRSSAASGC